MRCDSFPAGWGLRSKGQIGHRGHLASSVMEPDDRPDAVYLTVGVVKWPAALLTLAVSIIAAVAWLVTTSGDLSMTATLINGK